MSIRQQVKIKKLNAINFTRVKRNFELIYFLLGSWLALKIWKKIFLVDTLKDYFFNFRAT